MSQENTFTAKEEIAAVFRRQRRVFFVGIGGIGMRALAILLATRGHTVLGSDRALTAEAGQELAAHGIAVYAGHSAAHLSGCEVLIYSLAVPQEAPELCEARARGIPCFSRADLLGALMAEYPVRVAVAGMHGKSTVTAMLSEILTKAGRDPTVVSGAPLSPSSSPLCVGSGELFLAEACEYRNSFLCLSPSLAVVLNAELEHTDFFHDEKEVQASFTAFVQGVGTLVLPTAPSRALPVPSKGSCVIRFGTEKEADVRAVNPSFPKGCPAFDLYIQEKNCGRVNMKLLGAHNMQNALAAAAAAHALAVPPALTVAALSEFGGATGRLEQRGVHRGVRLYADYAHHPTEVRASLSALAALKGEGARLFCIFQPHTYSRTAAFFCDFVSALSAADRVILTDIYAAREKNAAGLSSSLLADALLHGVYAADFETAAALLFAEAREGDIAVVMGAGDIGRIFSLL